MRGRGTGGHGVFATSTPDGLGGAAVYALARGARGIALFAETTSTDAAIVETNTGTGDLLAAPFTSGHATRAGDDPPACSVIGKALSGLAGGRCLVGMLVMLR